MPARLPYTQQIITSSGRMKTLYPISCAYCSTPSFGFRRDDGRRFCSRPCSTNYQYKNGRDGYEATKNARAKTKSMDYRPLYGARGANHRNWKGGVTVINEGLRKTTVYRDWRRAVLKRDNYTCVTCGNQENLQVDHIQPFAFYPELRTSLDNGRTLCIDCHRLTPTYGPKAKRFATS